MTLLNGLSTSAKPSIGVYIDRYTREIVGEAYSVFSKKEVDEIVSSVKSFYERSKSQTPYYLEIRQALQSKEFLIDLSVEVVRFLENRPIQERIDLYIGLCKKYNFTPNIIANKDKLELRINKIIKTNGKTQDV